MPVPRTYSPCLSLSRALHSRPEVRKVSSFLELSLQRELSVCVYRCPPHTLCVEHEPHADIHIHTRMIPSVHTCTRSHPYVCTMNIHACYCDSRVLAFIHPLHCIQRAYQEEHYVHVANLHTCSNLSQRRFGKRDM